MGLYDPGREASVPWDWAETKDSLEELECWVEDIVGEL